VSSYTNFITDLDRTEASIRRAELIEEYRDTIKVHLQSIDTDLEKIATLMREDGQDQSHVNEVLLMRDFLRQYHENVIQAKLSVWKTYLKARKARRTRGL
jgi:hypothetical protein